MRDFNDADREKKSKRISTDANPADFPAEVLQRLEVKIRDSLKEGYLPCAVAFKIADEEKVPRIAVGNLTDRLGHRITNCQIGCFKVDKTFFDDTTLKTNDVIIGELTKLKEKDELTCISVFELAKKLNAAPMLVGNTASLKGLKVRKCQLGCF